MDHQNSLWNRCNYIAKITGTDGDDRLMIKVKKSQLRNVTQLYFRAEGAFTKKRRICIATFFPVHVSVRVRSRNCLGRFGVDRAP